MNVQKLVTLANFLLVLCYGLMLQSIQAAPSTTDKRIKIDQFGYVPAANKVAVISSPIVGFNAGNTLAPASTYEVRSWEDDSVVFSDAITAWNGGALHEQSGDEVWWFDFSSVTTPGNYYIYDPVNDIGSYQFSIAEDVYLPVMHAAMRSYYYQRCNFVKEAPYAETGWEDAASFLGAEQDSDCRLVSDTSPSTSQDLTGGWFDAGDYNKYINFADGVIHDLLAAYEQNPNVWGDDYNIPESGNDVPDILDEVKYELDWFLKMQQPDGGVLHKISVTTFNATSPPSSDTGARRYAPVSSSATISACGAFAHAALVYQASDSPYLQAYGATLEAAAIAAWTWTQNNPSFFYYNNAGFVNANASEDENYNQPANLASAAVYLFALTGNTDYQDHFDNFWPDMHLNQWYFAYPFEDEYQDAALYYTTIQGATASIASEIISRYSGSISNDYLPTINDGAYRALLGDNNYVWGSNGIKCVKGLLFNNMIYYGLDVANNSTYRSVAAGYMHYVHGINPLAMTYLSNMNNYGAENSVTQFYHAWFFDGHPLWDQVGVSTYGPAPGFLTGGPNPSFAPDPSYGGIIEPPQNQPIQKSYYDWNATYPENSWEITENSITYQSPYIKLLSNYLPPVQQTKVQLKVLLEGAYDTSTSLMTTNLSDDSLLPLKQPFNRAPWNYAGKENTLAIPSNVVDWILVEARDATDNTIILEERAAFMLADGTVADMNGQVGINFYELTDGMDYYISIKHRNHLAVMSANSITLPNSITYAFDNPSKVLGGSEQLKEVATGTYALAVGDFNSDGIISVADFNQYTTQISLINVYADEDANLDDAVTVADFNLYKVNASLIGVAQIRY